MILYFSSPLVLLQPFLTLIQERVWSFNSFLKKVKYLLFIYFSLILCKSLGALTLIILLQKDIAHLTQHRPCLISGKMRGCFKQPVCTSKFAFLKCLHICYCCAIAQWTMLSIIKAELLQLNRTQFPSLGIFVSKKVGNRKNLVFSNSNFFINKNSQGRKLSAKKIPTFGNSALV